MKVIVSCVCVLAWSVTAAAQTPAGADACDRLAASVTLAMPA